MTLMSHCGNIGYWHYILKVTGFKDGSSKTPSICECKRLQWSRGSVLAFCTQVPGFKPDRSRWIFQGEKILSTPPFGRDVKSSVHVVDLRHIKDP